MADLGWLRHFGQRPRTPTISSIAPEDHEYLSSPAKSSHSPSRRPRQRPGKAVRRVSSLLSLGGDSHINTSLSSPTLASFKTTHSDASGKSFITNQHNVSLDDHPRGSSCVSLPKNKSEIFLREADRTWYNPSPEQMIEALQVAIMNKPNPLAPIPLEYNGHVMALIEAYEKLKRELNESKQTAAEEVAEVKKMRMRELESYRSMSEDWLAREAGYLAEIKRLELLLAEHSKEGMETVALARAASVVERGARARKGFQERVKRLSRGDDGDDSETTPVKAKAKASAGLAKNPSVYTHIGIAPLNLDPSHDRRVSEQLKPNGRRTANKHRRPSRGKRSTDQTVMGDQGLGQETYVPTGVPAYRPRGHEGPLDNAHRQSNGGFDSSSSSSSEDTPSAWKGKEVDRTGDATVPALRSNGHADPNSAGDEDLGPTQYKTMGELAIERFLAGVSMADAYVFPEVDSPGSVIKDYFSRPNKQENGTRSRPFSFAPGDDNSLQVSPTTHPDSIQHDGSSGVQMDQMTRNGDTIEVSAGSNIRQPLPWSAAAHPGGISVAGQLQLALGTEGSDVDLSSTSSRPANGLTTPLSPPAVATPNLGTRSSRPTSTGSVVFVGDRSSTTRSRDSNSSRVTVLRDNSGRTSSRRQNSQSQAASSSDADVSSPGPDSRSSPPMSPILEKQASIRQVTSSPSPSLRRGGAGRTSNKRRSGGGTASSTTSSETRPPSTAPLPRPGSPTSSSGRRPTPPVRTASGASGVGDSSARIAAALAVARGLRRRESEGQ